MPPTLIQGDRQHVLDRGEVTVGRQDTCDIVIRDASLSRAHATFSIKKDRVDLVDNGSSNGTFVNGARVPSAILKHGDAVRLGAIDFRFEWPESVVQVAASPISAAQAQQIKQKIAASPAMTVDWKVPLVSTAGLGAGATGVIAGILGVIVGTSTGTAGGLTIALAIGVMGGIGTALAIKSLANKRVVTQLQLTKDDLDLYYMNQKPDLDLPTGFPELVEVIHSVRLGGELIKDRVANEWKQKLYEAQLMLEQQRSVDASDTTSRGFDSPMLAFDEGFRLRAWNLPGRGLLRLDVPDPAGMHLMELVHNQQLGGMILNALGGTSAGQVIVTPRVLSSPLDGRPLDLVITHAPGGAAEYRFVVFLVPS